MVEVYGLVPEYSGRGRPPTRKQARPGWQYLQLVKQRDEHGHVQGVKLRVIFGKKSELIKLLGHSTAYIEWNHLTGPANSIARRNVLTAQAGALAGV